MSVFTKNVLRTGHYFIKIMYGLLCAITIIRNRKYKVYVYQLTGACNLTLTLQCSVCVKVTALKVSIALYTTYPRPKLTERVCLQLSALILLVKMEVYVSLQTHVIACQDGKDPYVPQVI